MDSTNSAIDSDVWERIQEGGNPGKFLWRCKACNTLWKSHHRSQHETRGNHQANLSKLRVHGRRPPSPPIRSEADRRLIGAVALHFAHEMAHPPGTSYSHPELPPLPAPLHRGLNLQPNDFRPGETIDEEEYRRAGELTEDLIMGGPFNYEGDSWLHQDGEQNGDSDAEGQGGETRRRRTLDDIIGSDEEWYPWCDRITCALDILMHLPRSVFSRNQLELMLWLLRVTGVSRVPSLDHITDWCKDINRIYGVDSIPYHGALGHLYYVNSLSQILSQEFANPKVREKLEVLPEDAGVRLGEARQGLRWLHELHPELLTPWQRIANEDYFTFEPALVTGSRIVIPIRWFEREGKVFAKCWDMQGVEVDGLPCWRAYVRSTETEVAASEFLKPYPALKQDMEANPDVYHNSPPLFPILHVYHEKDGTLTPWDTERWSNEDGSFWRRKSGGRPVYSVPLWLYCDDTSGNQSKKWNKHNSWLFTLAGLPRSEVTREYNVHFLSTSNLAAPLEMLDGIAEQITAAQEEGIWAWDCLDKGGYEPGQVLIFPVVLALLGDNPMQSEMACHIGLAGRKFCRVCEVEGGKNQKVPVGTDVPSNEHPNDEKEDLGRGVGAHRSCYNEDFTTRSLLSTPDYHATLTLYRHFASLSLCMPVDIWNSIGFLLSRLSLIYLAELVCDELNRLERDRSSPTRKKTGFCPQVHAAPEEVRNDQRRVYFILSTEDPRS